jgi:hypothetical protein
MAKPEKIGVPDKVHRDKDNDKKFKIDKGNQPNEVDIEIDILENGNYAVDKLKVDELEKEVPQMPDGTPIRWFNNFSIKENGNYIKKKYTVTINDLQGKLGKGSLAIYSETRTPPLYYYAGTINGDTFDLDDGDPGIGSAP